MEIMRKGNAMAKEKARVGMIMYDLQKFGTIVLEIRRFRHIRRMLVLAKIWNFLPIGEF